MVEGIGLEIRQVTPCGAGVRIPPSPHRKRAARPSFCAEKRERKAAPHGCGASEKHRSAACGRKSEVLFLTSSEKTTAGKFFRRRWRSLRSKFESPLLRTERGPKGPFSVRRKESERPRHTGVARVKSTEALPAAGEKSPKFSSPPGACGGEAAGVLLSHADAAKYPEE